MIARLTPKMKAFAEAFIETNNQSEAYRRAYDAKGMKDAVVHVKACELMKKPAVAACIAELQGEHRKRHEVTVDSLTEMLKADRELARMEKDVGSAISAVLAIAKLHGLIVDKKKVDVDADHKHHHTVEPLSHSARWVEGLLGAGPGREAQGALPN